MQNYVLYLFYSKQHSQHPRSYKSRELKNKMDRVTEKLAVKGSKERVIQLISRKVGKESKKKMFKRRNWSTKKCESNNDTITEELVSSSGNIPI